MLKVENYGYITTSLNNRKKKLNLRQNKSNYFAINEAVLTMTNLNKLDKFDDLFNIKLLRIFHPENCVRS